MPPRSPSHKSKRQGATGSSSVAASDAGSANPSERDIIEFTKEDVEALLNEEIKGNNKKSMEQMRDLIKRLQLCVLWYLKIHEVDTEFKQTIASGLRAYIKTDLKNMKEFDKRISDLKERIVKQELDKLEADNCCREEKEARNAAEKVRKEKSAELEWIQDMKSAVEQMANLNKDLFKKSRAVEDELKNMKKFDKRISDTIDGIVKQELVKLEARNAAEKVCKEKSTELEWIQDVKSAELEWIQDMKSADEGKAKYYQDLFEIAYDKYVEEIYHREDFA